MRYKAILAELARKRYPLSIMLMVIGVLLIPFPYLFIHYGLEFTNFWWSLLGICIGVVNGSLFIGLGFWFLAALAPEYRPGKKQPRNAEEVAEQ